MGQIRNLKNRVSDIEVIYDDDIKNVKPGKGPAPQVLQLMGIGFAYNFSNYK